MIAECGVRRSVIQCKVVQCNSSTDATERGVLGETVITVFTGRILNVRVAEKVQQRQKVE